MKGDLRAIVSNLTLTFLGSIGFISLIFGILIFSGLVKSCFISLVNDQTESMEKRLQSLEQRVKVLESK